MSRHRTLLAVAALAAATLIALLLFAVRGSSADGTGADATPPEKPAQPRAEAPAAPAPALPSAEIASEIRSAAAANQEYVDHIRTDGTFVRDHRGGAETPKDDEGPIRVPKKLARVDSSVIIAVRRELQPIVRRCSKEHRGEYEVERPRLQADLTVAIDGREAQVVEARVRLTGAAEGALDVCVHNQALGIRVPAPGHKEVDRHRLTFPFPLR